MTRHDLSNGAGASDTGSGMRLTSIAKAIAWMVLGGLIVVGAAFLTGVLPPSTTGHDADPTQTHGDAQLWTCGMHPEVIQAEPGICPICHMDLTPLESGAATPRAPGQEEHRGDTGQLWTCPMHPEILEPEPGSCPICGMDLVPVADHGDSETTPTDRGDHAQGTTVTIDPVFVQNMNVRVESAQRLDLSRSIRTVGYLEYDQEHMVSVTTRFSGFVEQVFINYVGQPVRRGEPLFEVFSPELVQTQQELLSAIHYARRMSGADAETRSRAESLVEAARQRLAYWDITDDQVAEIEASGRVLRTLTVVSPVAGVVMQREHGLEGLAIRPGMEALHVADLSTLWLTVEVYEDQLPWLAEGATAEVSFDSFPGERFSGRVRYVEPEVSPSTRTVKLTLAVPNRGGRLRVGMYASVTFNPVIAREAVVVPAQAVIRSGERDVVVVALGEGRFAPREVTIGPQSDGLVQVLSGLDGTERIVTSAQFLIDSESNLRAAVARMIASRTAHQH